MFSRTAASKPSGIASFMSEFRGRLRSRSRKIADQRHDARPRRRHRRREGFGCGALRVVAAHVVHRRLGGIPGSAVALNRRIDRIDSASRRRKARESGEQAAAGRGACHAASVRPKMAEGKLFIKKPGPDFLSKKKRAI
jgi:hypothetical protein